MKTIWLKFMPETAELYPAVELSELIGDGVKFPMLFPSSERNYRAVFGFNFTESDEL